MRIIVIREFKEFLFNYYKPWDIKNQVDIDIRITIK